MTPPTSLRAQRTGISVCLEKWMQMKETHETKTCRARRASSPTGRRRRGTTRPPRLRVTVRQLKLDRSERAKRERAGAPCCTSAFHRPSTWRLVLLLPGSASTTPAQSMPSPSRSPPLLNDSSTALTRTRSSAGVQAEGNLRSSFCGSRCEDEVAGAEGRWRLPSGGSLDARSAGGSEE